MSTRRTIPSPFRQAIHQVMGMEPPRFVRGWSCRDLTEDEAAQLQDWCASNMHKTLTPWGTGIGAIEAAETIVNVAVENGNLRGVKS